MWLKTLIAGREGMNIQFLKTSISKNLFLVRNFQYIVLNSRTSASIKKQIIPDENENSKEAELELVQYISRSYK